MDCVMKKMKKIVLLFWNSVECTTFFLPLFSFRENVAATAAAAATDHLCGAVFFCIIIPVGGKECITVSVVIKSSSHSRRNWRTGDAMHIETEGRRGCGAARTSNWQ